MLRRCIILTATVLLLTVAGGVAPADAGLQGPTVEIVKATEGPAPDGFVYEIDLECPESGDTTVELEDGESIVLPFDFGEQCTVTETVDGGADDVTYECEDIVGVDCVTDSSFESEENGVELPEVRVTVTNSFDPEPTTTTTLATTTTAAAAPAAAAVVATPAFTG